RASSRARTPRPGAEYGTTKVASYGDGPGEIMSLTPSAEALAAHHELVAAVRDSRLAEHRAAKLLARVADQAWHNELGYSTIRDSAEAELQLAPRQTRPLLQLGRALPGLPLLDQALSEGRLGWTKARELLRVARADNEAAWLTLAETLTS